MYENAKAFILKYGIENVGFLTITPRDSLVDRVEASRRFHSLAENVLNKHYGAWLRVFERMKSGRIHYHLLVWIGRDIRTGLDFEAIKRRDYRSANHALRNEWRFWRDEAPKYGWGRCELLPIRTNEEGAAKYVAKYVNKHIGSRAKEDKGARLFGSSDEARVASVRFSWTSPGAYLWRAKLGLFAEIMGFRSVDDIKKKYGAKWGYHLREAIAALDLGAYDYPTIEHAVADGWLSARDMAELEAIGADMTAPISRPWAA